MRCITEMLACLGVCTTMHCLLRKDAVSIGSQCSMFCACCVSLPAAELVSVLMCGQYASPSGCARRAMLHAAEV